MQRLKGKVAFVTGVARGQGRSHAVRLAEEGADVIGLDICEQIESVQYEMGTREDMKETERLVEAEDRNFVGTVADVRDEAAVQAAFDAGLDAFGRVDIVVANAGIGSVAGPAEQVERRRWDDMIDTNLTGLWVTAKAAIPTMIAQGEGGSIAITSSVRAFRPIGNVIHYNAAKAGAVGIMQSLAWELAPHSIRVNSIHPTQVDTPMIQNDFIRELFCPDVESPTREQFAEVSSRHIPLPIPWVEPRDIANAVVWLASDEARYISGVALPVDGGQLLTSAT